MGYFPGSAEVDPDLSVVLHRSRYIRHYRCLGAIPFTARLCPLLLLLPVQLQGRRRRVTHTWLLKLGSALRRRVNSGQCSIVKAFLLHVEVLGTFPCCATAPVTLQVSDMCIGKATCCATMQSAAFPQAEFYCTWGIAQQLNLTAEVCSNRPPHLGTSRALRS